MFKIFETRWTFNDFKSDLDVELTQKFLDLGWEVVLPYRPELALSDYHRCCADPSHDYDIESNDVNNFFEYQLPEFLRNTQIVIKQTF